MRSLERQLAETRAARDAARAVFEARLGQVRRALGERSVPQRLGDEAITRAVDAAEEGIAVAQESKWVLVGTGLAVLAWLLRRPLVNSARRLAGRLPRPNLSRAEPASPWQRLRGWIMTKVPS